MSIEEQPAQTTPAKQPQPDLLEGDHLKHAANKLMEEILDRILTRQSGVPTFCDSNLLDLVKKLQQLDKRLPWEESVRRLGSEGEILAEALRRLQSFLWRRSQGRYVDFQDRFADTPEGPRSDSDIGMIESAMSQGVSECMQWKTVPLFKTVYDFSIYTMMLWNLKPKTIFELGSGIGASAVWLADLMKVFEIEGHIYSVDLKKSSLEHKGVSFLQGNCMEVEKIFEDEFLRSAPHPWLLIEDAHVNVYGVFSFFHPYIRQGDYVVVEDTMNPGKREAIGSFMTEHPNFYKVDTYYTDFFGRNATCSRDSIFARLY